MMVMLNEALGSISALESAAKTIVDIIPVVQDICTVDKISQN